MFENSGLDDLFTPGIDVPFRFFDVTDGELETVLTGYANRSNEVALRITDSINQGRNQA